MCLMFFIVTCFMIIHYSLFAFFNKILHKIKYEFNLRFYIAINLNIYLTYNNLLIGYDQWEEFSIMEIHY